MRSHRIRNVKNWSGQNQTSRTACYGHEKDTGRYMTGMQDDNWLNELESVEESINVGRKFLFDDELFGEQGKTRVHLTWEERRKLNQHWAKTSNGSTSMQLKKEQEEDPNVQRWIAQDNPTRIKRIKGVLCDVWRFRDSPDTIYEQIVLQKKILSTGDQVSSKYPFCWARRTGEDCLEITTAILLDDAVSRCETCKEHQLHVGRKVKAPMTPLPVIGEPFRRIAMDISWVHFPERNEGTTLS